MFSGKLVGIPTNFRPQCFLPNSDRFYSDRFRFTTSIYRLIWIGRKSVGKSLFRPIGWSEWMLFVVVKIIKLYHKILTLKINQISNLPPTYVSKQKFQIFLLLMFGSRKLFCYRILKFFAPTIFYKFSTILDGDVMTLILVYMW